MLTPPTHRNRHCTNPSTSQPRWTTQHPLLRQRATARWVDHGCYHPTTALDSARMPGRPTSRLQSHERLHIIQHHAQPYTSTAPICSSPLNHFYPSMLSIFVEKTTPASHVPTHHQSTFFDLARQIHHIRVSVEYDIIGPPPFDRYTYRWTWKGIIIRFCGSNTYFRVLFDFTRYVAPACVEYGLIIY
jgi:hypothetical protein